MKANKQIDQAGSDSIDKRAPPEATNRDAQLSTDGVGAGKARGRLNRVTLSRLGKALHAYVDVVRKEGVPERFRRLLDEYDLRQLHLQGNGGATDKGHSL